MTEYGLAGIELMENAGAAAARVMQERGLARRDLPVLVLCGCGNNGGDGLVIARRLKESGVPVTAVLVGRAADLKGDSRTNAHRLAESGLALFEMHDAVQLHPLLSERPVVVDALLGTGLSQAPRGMLAAVIRVLNDAHCRVVSVDMPSGVDATTGRAHDPSVCAELTVTMGYDKLGLWLYPARAFAGHVIVVDIGLPPDAFDEATDFFLVEDADVRRWLPARRPDGHKGTFGSALLIAGSRGMTGAAVLAASAALRSGVGLVRVAVPESSALPVEVGHVESVKHPLPDDGTGRLTMAALEQLLTLAASADCVALGPGIGTHPDTVLLIRELIGAISTPLVIDADGINCLASEPGLIRQRLEATVLTPHPGEFSRLTGDCVDAIDAARAPVAQRFARLYGCTLLLKGASSVTASPDGVVRINPTGNSGLATGGSGDVLTGLVAGLIAQGCSTTEAAASAAFLHGRAADIAAVPLTEYCLTASDIVVHLPQAFNSVIHSD